MDIKEQQAFEFKEEKCLSKNTIIFVILMVLIMVTSIPLSFSYSIKLYYLEVFGHSDYDDSYYAYLGLPAVLNWINVIGIGFISVLVQMLFYLIYKKYKSLCILLSLLFTYAIRFVMYVYCSYKQFTTNNRVPYYIFCGRRWDMPISILYIVCLILNVVLSIITFLILCKECKRNFGKKNFNR